MTVTEVKLPIDIDRLRQILRSYGIVQAAVFGSYARGEQRPDSDLDLYIRCKPGTSLFDIIGLQDELEKQSGVSVDLVTKINKNFEPYIEPDLVQIDL